MHKLETNDWLVLNNIIYKIYTTKDFDKMRSELMERLKLLLDLFSLAFFRNFYLSPPVLDFDSGDFFLSGEDNKLCNPVTFNCEANRTELYDDIDYSRGVMYSGKTMVYRETDIISDEVRIKTDYYKNVYQPNGWHYAIQVILAANKKFLGVITLYRNIGKDNFKYDDIFLLDMLKEHLSFRLNQEKKGREIGHGKLSVVEATEKYQLTKRESTILQLLLDGLENDEICDELSISVNTLKKHVLNIYKKLNINNRVQMFKMIREGK